MNVILCQDVARLGTRGQTRRVADGYARNFLFPRGLAAPATVDVVRRVASEQAAIQARLTKEQAYLRQLKETLEQKSLTIPVAVGPNEQLFGSVTNAHIAAALAQAGISIEKRKIALEAPITALGVYQVPVHLHAAIAATVNVSVVKQ